MIDEEKYKNLLDAGLSLDHYFLLYNIRNKIKIIENKRINGFKNLLIKKGYLDKGGKITESGEKIVEKCKDIPVTQQSLYQRVESLHKKIQDRLIELTGKKQVLTSIKKGSKQYYFLEGPRVLESKISRVMKIYNFKDLDKIEKVIINYVETCHMKNDWFPLLHYWILKDNVSQMMTAIDSMEDNEENIPIITSNQKFV